MIIKNLVDKASKNKIHEYLKKQNEYLIVERFNSKHSSDDIKFYTYNESARVSSMGEVSQRIKSYEKIIKELNDLKEDWIFLNSSDIDQLSYKEFIDKELKYKYYNLGE
jgi:hypothetical protein